MIEINNLEIMINQVSSKKPDHVYITFLEEAVKLIKRQDELLREQEVNVAQCFRTSVTYKAQDNISKRKVISLKKTIEELEQQGKTLSEQKADTVKYFDLFYECMFMMKYIFDSSDTEVTEERINKEQEIEDFMQLHTERYN